MSVDHGPSERHRFDALHECLAGGRLQQVALRSGGNRGAQDVCIIRGDSSLFTGNSRRPPIEQVHLTQGVRMAEALVVVSPACTH